MGRGKQTRAENHAGAPAKVAFEYTKDEKPKNKLLDNRSDGDSENNDH